MAEIPALTEIPDLSKTSLPELMQDLQEVEGADPRAEWTLEQVIEHACSLAIGYGAGRDDLLPEYKATKERALRMARQSRVRRPSVSDDDELAAACGDHTVAELLRRWETEQSEWFTNPTLEIVAEYAAWRERSLLEDGDWFRRQYPAAVASGDWEGVARLLSGRLRQMDKRAKAANKRADALEALIADCEQYLNLGETPRQRMDRDFVDMQAVLTLWAKDKETIETLKETTT